MLLGRSFIWELICFAKKKKKSLKASACALSRFQAEDAGTRGLGDVRLRAPACACGHVLSPRRHTRRHCCRWAPPRPVCIRLAQSWHSQPRYFLSCGAFPDTWKSVLQNPAAPSFPPGPFRFLTRTRTRHVERARETFVESSCSSACLLRLRKAVGCFSDES